MQKEKVRIAIYIVVLLLVIAGLVVARQAKEISGAGETVMVREAGGGEENGASDVTENREASGGTQVLAKEIVNGELTVISFSKEATAVTEQRFFSQDVKLVIDFPQGAKVYYTTNGSEPNGSSTEYTGPIELTAATGDFPNCLVLKAKAYYADGTKSEVITHTFFAQTGIKERFQTIVFSITGDPKDLTNQKTGILYGDNAYQRGSESEREVYVEALNSDGTLIFEQSAGVRPYGGASRGLSIKSMKLFARKEYDKEHGKFAIDVFGTVGADGEVMDEYDKLVLRNTGNDFQFAFVRDELNQSLAAQAGYTDCEAVVPVAVYLNGSYYGFFYLHESYCDDFFKDKYGGSEEGHYEVLEGNEKYKNQDDEDEENVAAAKEFNFMYNYLAYSDLTKDWYYEELCAFMDVENYLQYYAYNIYINNNDWPQNNYKCYRYYAGETQAYGDGETDGRWRFLFHDMDFSMGLYNSDETVAVYDNLEHILNPDDDRYSPLFANLMQREDCREYFLEEMDRLMTGTLSADNIVNTLDDMLADREQEMVYFFEHLEERKETDSSIWIWYDHYLERTDNIRRFANERREYMEKYLKEHFG